MPGREDRLIHGNRLLIPEFARCPQYTCMVEKQKLLTYLAALDAGSITLSHFVGHVRLILLTVVFDLSSKLDMGLSDCAFCAFEYLTGGQVFWLKEKRKEEKREERQLLRKERC